MRTEVEFDLFLLNLGLDTAKAVEICNFVLKLGFNVTFDAILAECAALVADFIDKVALKDLIVTKCAVNYCTVLFLFQSTCYALF